MAKICLVTTNYGKVVSFETVFGPYGIEIEHVDKELPEPQLVDLKEIAKQKVLAAYSLVRYHALVERPVIVQDSGFYLRAWPNFPGPFVKFAFNTLGPEGFMALVEKRERGCEFRECLAYTGDGNEVKFFEGKVQGCLADEPKGEITKEAWSGLWQIFVPEGQVHTVAEMTGEERAKWRRTRGENSAQKFAKWFSKNSK